MNLDFWSSRVHSTTTKRFSAVHATSLNSDNHLVLDDSDGDDDPRACFPCPFCYMEIEVNVLCRHLQEEHCFDLKNAVCPLCAANLGKDVIGHFVVQHASSLKRRRKSRKSCHWTGSSAMLGKELSSFLGPSTYSKGNAPDPLLSPFLSGVSHSDLSSIKEDEKHNKSATTICDLKSTELSLQNEDYDPDYEERRQRAAFVQLLFASTIF
ncbi:protein DEHYDRATION-INDUCED 19 6-like [Tripterygium wilfordii]|uniref:Protein DEHYDRATION-INDUCED 19 6-like n=1 Tax=Tripterygium wilfordii TaxID=458696 RepID=A0A7J7CDH6_TRIWF|nr:protein DEHYDRATION-INDUCED 19 homolog 5-like isoform X3 [Tripterygium wilfordii]KAF5732179.1 protein DEHYDRATION-INDUCED 19 6-like [Tripterygium wilfordii]